VRKKYPSYKDSGIKWIGKIPKEWKIKKIKYLYSVISGNGFNESLQGQESGDYPFCKVSDINHPGLFIELAKNFVSQEVVNSNKYNIIPIGSLIFAKIGEALKKNHRKINKVECIIDNNIQALIPSKKMDNIFFYYLFACIDMNWFDNGGTIPCINNQQLLNSFIPDITIDEQKRIVFYLDYKTQLIDKLIEKTKKKIELLKEKRIALINHCVTKGLNPDVEMKDSGVDWIGEIPINWRAVKIKYIIEEKGLIRGPFGSSLRIDSFVPFGYKVYEQKNAIYKNKDLGNYCIPQKKFDSLKRFEIKSDDFIMSCSGTIGKTYLFSDDFKKGIINQALLIIRFNKNKDIFHKYISFLMDSWGFQKQIIDNSQGGAMKNLVGISIFKSIKIPVPTMPEQKQIFKYLDEQTQKIDMLIDKENKRIKLLQGYRKSLISEVVTGKIDVRDEVVA
jgi:type I restriction enzyme, S subunit